jgi:hypothetical protein
MSEFSQPVGQLRGATQPSATLVGSLGERELLTRHAKRGTQHVASMRCVERAGQVLVECQVYPVDSLRVEPLRAGPYTFAAEHEARRFLEEATLALQYLGCDVFDSAA